jgi:hypothetical protein
MSSYIFDIQQNGPFFSTRLRSTAGRRLSRAMNVGAIGAENGAYGSCQTASAVFTTSSSFARWSAGVSGLPPAVLAKPH